MNEDSLARSLSANLLCGGSSGPSPISKRPDSSDLPVILRTKQIYLKHMIDETMAMQGSVWVMPRKWWENVIGELQTEGYGPLIQDSHEMVFKTWKAGGKLVLHKGTWFAHKHRSFSRTHNSGTSENPAKCGEGYKYALEVWGDYYQNEIRKQWRI